MFRGATSLHRDQQQHLEVQVQHPAFTPSSLLPVEQIVDVCVRVRVIEHISDRCNRSPVSSTLDLIFFIIIYNARARNQYLFISNAAASSSPQRDLPGQQRCFIDFDNVGGFRGNGLHDG